MKEGKEHLLKNETKFPTQSTTNSKLNQQVLKKPLHCFLHTAAEWPLVIPLHNSSPLTSQHAVHITFDQVNNFAKLSLTLLNSYWHHHISTTHLNPGFTLYSTEQILLNIPPYKLVWDELPVHLLLLPLCWLPLLLRLKHTPRPKQETLHWLHQGLWLTKQAIIYLFVTQFEHRNKVKHTFLLSW